MINEYVSVDNKVSTTSIMTEKEMLAVAQNSKDSDDGSDNRFNDAVPEPSISKVQKMINTEHYCYLEARD